MGIESRIENVIPLVSIDKIRGSQLLGMGDGDANGDGDSEEIAAWVGYCY